MTILGIGVDVVHVTRILALINRRSPKLLAIRILSAKEMEEWGDVGSADITSQARFLAVRWSLKEAGYKALFPHDKPTWKEFSVLRINDKKPILSYTPRNTSAFTDAKFHCSVSHDGDYVFSTVLAEQI